MKRIILKRGEEKRILQGHPWVYDNEVAQILGPSGPAVLEAGETADVESAGKNYLGRAIVNPASKISARIYSPSKEGIDKGFFKRRIRQAVSRRLETCGLSCESARLVFAEADFLPGLIIDRYAGWPLADIERAGLPRPLDFRAVSDTLGPPSSWLAVQFLTYGMDCRCAEILAALEEVLAAPLTPPGRAPAASPAADPTVPGRAVQPTADSAVSDPAAQNLSPKDTQEAATAGNTVSGPTERSLSSQEAAAGAMLGRVPFGDAVSPSLGLPAGIIEKSGAKVRDLEGLPPQEGLIQGRFPQGGIVIFENGLAFALNLESGQKTGHFLDQRDNRRRAAAFAKNGARVLDAFSYTGGFSIHAARAGAGSVTAIDVSAEALAALQQNAALNGVESVITPIKADVFDTLRSMERAKEKFDLVILDPPAFAKSHTALDEAIRGYKEINLRAFKLLKSGGVLVTCSCSHALDEYHFKRTIAAAAQDAERRIYQLDFRCQSPDHPILIGYDESLYLKAGFYRVV